MMFAVILKSDDHRIIRVFLTSGLLPAELNKLEVAAAFNNQDIDYLEVEEVPHSASEIEIEIKASRKDW